MIKNNNRVISYPYKDTMLISDEHWATRSDGYSDPFIKRLVYSFAIDSTWYFDIAKGDTNSLKQWYVHIDNADRQTIAAFEVSSIQEFNDFMIALRIPFRLSNNEVLSNKDVLNVYHWSFHVEADKITVIELRTNDCIGTLPLMTGLDLLYKEVLIYMDEEELFNYLDNNMTYV